MESFENFVKHAGVKGMRWGVRKDGSTSSTAVSTSRIRRPAQDVVVKQKAGKFVRTAGGKRQTASDDAVKTAATKQFAKKSTTDSLSTKQLQEAVTRMNLEMQYSKLLKQNDRRTRGQRMVQKILGLSKDKDAGMKAGKVAGAFRDAGFGRTATHTKEPPMKRPVRLSIL